MRVLVTGARGLLGQKLVSLLHKTPDIEVIATAKEPIPYPCNTNRFELLNIISKKEVEHVIAGMKPDVVIHTAAMTHVDYCEQHHKTCREINTTAVQYLTDACKNIQARFIFISTDFVFDGKHGKLSETAIPHPINYYGKNKLDAEEVVKKSGLDWAIIRTALVYGVASTPNRSNIVLWVKKNLEQSKPIRVVNDQWRTPTLVEDLAMGCYLVAYYHAQGIYHISGMDVLTPYDIALQTAQFFSLDASFISPTDSITFKQPAKRPLKTDLIIDKARKKLQYRPHSFQEGLQIVASQLSPG